MTDWFTRAQAVIPGGVNSPVRAFGSVGGEPFFTASAHGAHLTTTDGRQLIDWIQSWGATIHGHAHPTIVDAVQQAATRGTSYGTPTTAEVELAEAICARVASVEKIRLVSSGTEAAMTAVRLARGATGRSKIVKFAGCYHGHLDSLLVAAGSGVATFGLPGSAGVTEGTVADTIVIPYNDLTALGAVFSMHGSEIAAVLVEPIAANMGLVAPQPGFLEGIRKVCTANGALCVFDEVITGFRVARGGAQELFGIEADITVMGKVVGGGMPLAALGGRAEIMDELAPLGAVYQAGTLAGNPIATAAGLAALAMLDDDAYERLTDSAEALAAQLTDAFDSEGVAAQVTRAGTLVGMFFSDEPVTNYAQAQQADHARYARWFHGMLARGVYVAPSGYETMFPGLAHDDEHIATTAAAAAEATRD